MSNAWRHQPSVCVLVHECRIAIRAARAGCIFTDGADREPVGLQPELGGGLVEIRLRHALDDEACRG